MTVTYTPITRDVVTVAGPDATKYLQGQVSQDVDKLAPGEVGWTFVLQPQGKVDGWARITRLGHDEYRLDTDAGAGETLLARLLRFKLRTDATIELAAGAPVLAVRGADDPAGVVAGWPGIEGADVFVDGDGVDSAADTVPAGAVELAADGYGALRIRHGVPAMGAELTEDTIPAEAGQWVIDASVSFTKGCFTGQELVARIDSRGGNVPRHLRGVQFAGPPPEPGSALTIDGKDVGTVTSAAPDGEGGAVALAFVHRSIEVPATAIAPDGTEARIVALPFA
jgi:folate-binding protein YgfZ